MTGGDSICAASMRERVASEERGHADARLRTAVVTLHASIAAVTAAIDAVAIAHDDSALCNIAELKAQLHLAGISGR